MQTPARYAREEAQRYRLEAAKCKACGKVHFPPRRVCPCGGTEFETINLPRTGKVLAHTVIRVGPSQFKDETPYVNAIVELDGGVKINCMLADVDPSKVRRGMKVRLEFRKVMKMGTSGILCYGYKAVPARKYRNK